jgi:hypothetical protein
MIWTISNVGVGYIPDLPVEPADRRVIQFCGENEIASIPISVADTDRQRGLRHHATESDVR